MIEIFAMLFSKAWDFMNLSYVLCGVTVKLYYPFVFITICTLVWNMVFVTSNGVNEIHPEGIRENMRAYREHRYWMNYKVNAVNENNKEKGLKKL
jgi:hypothetical protein